MKRGDLSDVQWARLEPLLPAMCRLHMSGLVAVTVDQVERVLAGLWLMAMAGH